MKARDDYRPAVEPTKIVAGPEGRVECKCSSLGKQAQLRKIFKMQREECKGGEPRKRKGNKRGTESCSVTVRREEGVQGQAGVPKAAAGDFTQRMRWWVQAVVGF